jgi:hypothetical protein
LRDFSNIFHSLIVLSAGVESDTAPAAARNAGKRVLTIGAEQEMGLVSSSAPSDLVDLLLDLERLEVVKLGLVRLKLGVKLVLAALFGLVALEQDDAASFVA